MKKHTLLLVCLLTIFVSTQAQPWLKLLPQEKRSQDLTLKDHKQAFDTYWKPYNVKGGYYYENGVKKKAYGWKQFMRWHYDMQFQVDANGAFPTKSAQEIYEKYQKSKPKSNEYSASWVSLGTNSSDGGYAGIGRVNTVAFHPTDNNTYWVGAPAGGLWVTRDNGSSWTCLTDQNHVQGVSDIVIPSDYETSKTIYIGTGDRDGWDNRGIGVLKSTDDGATWQTTGLSFTLASENRINRLLLAPTDNQTIIAATNNGVYKTTNGGTNWNKLSDNVFIDMEYKPTDFSTLYGSTQDGKIYRSTNAGNSWNEVFFNGRRVELAVTPANANLVVAVVSTNSGGLFGVYKSMNSGASFSVVLSGADKNLLGYNADGSGTSGQGWYDLSIAVSPTDENEIFVGGINTWKTTDGGTTWELSNKWSGLWTSFPQVVHADKHILKYRANGDLFEGNDGGIYILPKNGNKWIDKSNGLVISQIYRLGVSAQNSNIVITGLQDNGTKLLENGTWRDVKGGDGMECLIDYTNSDIQYATYANGQITRTTDNWKTKKDIEPANAGDGAWVTPYTISPTDHNTIYAGYADVWKTTDQGNNWTKISDFQYSYELLNNMAIAPSNADVLYVTTEDEIWKTTNEGSNWTKLDNTNLPSAYISSITIKNNDPNHLWLTFSGYNSDGVYESTDGGISWTNISAGLPEVPVYTIVQNKLVTDEVHLYAGTELGVYFKKGNANWIEYNEGLPNVQSRELEIYYDEQNLLDSRLRLASYGRGLWETPLVSDLPQIITSEATSITENSAVLTVNITSDGGSPITARGIVWGTTTQPTLSDNVITDTNTGIGEFTANITGLSASSTYYARAYATINNATTYGNEVVFNTLCGTITEFPYEQGFEDESFPPLCWTSFIGTNGEGNENNWTTELEPHTGKKCAYIKYSNLGENAEDWLVTPALSLPSGSAVLSFYEKERHMDVYSSHYAVKISTTSQTDISSFTDLVSYDENSLSINYTKREVDLSAYKGQTVYIAFVSRPEIALHKLKKDEKHLCKTHAKRLFIIF